MRLTFTFPLGDILSMDLEKCVMTYIHHYVSYRVVSISPKIFCVLPIHYSLISGYLGTH